MTHLGENLRSIRARIEAAAQRSGRTSDSVRLLCVSKGHPLEAIDHLAAMGCHAFAESFVDEALPKIRARPEVEWHFIGPLQSNKTRAVAEHFDWVHSVDRLKLVRRLAAQRPQSARKLNVLIQVTLGGEAHRRGLALDCVDEVLDAVRSSPALQARGLMVILPLGLDVAAQREGFAAVRSLYEAQGPADRWDTLSMGMSDDFEVAIEEGSTMVRVGTALFGPRQHHQREHT